MRRADQRPVAPIVAEETARQPAQHLRELSLLLGGSALEQVGEPLASRRDQAIARLPAARREGELPGLAVAVRPVDDESGPGEPVEDGGERGGRDPQPRAQALQHGRHVLVDLEQQPARWWVERKPGAGGHALVDPAPALPAGQHAQRRL